MNSPQNIKTFFRNQYQPPNFSFSNVAFDFQLNPIKTIVSSKIDVKRVSSGSLVLKGEDLELISLKINGELFKTYELSSHELILHHLPDVFVLEIICVTRPDQNSSLMGLYVSEGNFFTQCEAEGFRKITYFLDQPDVLSCYQVRLTANKINYPVLLSNGNLIEQTDLDHGMHTALWNDPFPKPSYLFAIVAGQLHCVEKTITTSSGAKKLLQVWVREADLSKTAHAMESLVKAISWDEARFGLELDLERFMIVAVSDFNMGAMENKGLNIFNTKYVLADAQSATDTDFANIESVVGHEYFHNWTGNRVTCRDWFQLSLKEGLTVFRDQEFSADLMGSVSGRAVKRIDDVRLLRQVQFPEDAGPMAHPIRPDSYQEINNFYTVTIYEKGAEIIRMQHTLLGEAGFRKGMDLYFERHDGQAVTCDDFIHAMSDANQVNLDQFKNWYSQAGTPRVRVEERFDDQKQSYHLTLSQSCLPTPGQERKPLFHIPLKTKLLIHDVATDEMMIELKDQTQTFNFENLTSKPILSINRDFSAPVILDFEQSIEDLYFLFERDDNPFNQWEAGQKIAIELILSSKQAPQELLAIWEQHLRNPKLDPSFKTLVLTLPAESYLHEQVQEINPAKIHLARRAFRHAMAGSLKQTWIDIFEQNQSTDAYSPTPEQAGKRELKNIALQMILENDVTEGGNLAEHQFKTSNNMTDRLAALSALVQYESPLADACLENYYHRYEADDLAIDKWFSIQASRQVNNHQNLLEQIYKLKKHPAFKIRNPNRVRSLIHTFCMNNPGGFHDISGGGYQFWLENILELDKINPQVAARLARALDRWKKFADPYQTQMRICLEKANQHPLSNDVSEVIQKALT
ncbi:MULTISPECIES: aminopeptidase N [unclassified Polynucleobacter]|uniref:aminopeptidase N n=1 Tax=unclassified Polynucleobacter TaxID=2640945 RepID=UPI002491D869|nr:MULTISPECIES: aminopeptidase N [unclassified Polynucleobacter]